MKGTARPRQAKLLIRTVRGFKTLKTAYTTIKGFEVIRALVETLSLWYRVRKGAGIKDVRLHDFRHRLRLLGGNAGRSVTDRSEAPRSSAGFNDFALRTRP